VAATATGRRSVKLERKRQQQQQQQQQRDVTADRLGLRPTELADQPSTDLRTGIY